MTVIQFFGRGVATGPVIGRHTAIPVRPIVLDLMADVLDDTSTPRAVPPAERSWAFPLDRRRMRLAELRVEAATRRRRALRVARWRAIELRWRWFLGVVLGTGLLVGLLVLGLLTVFYLGPGPLLVLPALLALVAVIWVTARLRGSPEPQQVRGLDVATAEVRAARSAARRARVRWSARLHRTHEDMSRWCHRHGLPADAAALRELARQAEGRRRPATPGAP